MSKKQIAEAQQMIGRRIRQLRESMTLTQEQFAKRCRFSRPYLSAVESGQENLTLASLIHIANAAGMTLSIEFLRR